jgi:hypothetical protein
MAPASEAAYLGINNQKEKAHAITRGDAAQPVIIFSIGGTS